MSHVHVLSDERIWRELLQLVTVGSSSTIVTCVLNSNGGFYIYVLEHDGLSVLAVVMGYWWQDRRKLYCPVGR
jgi:hypothetical protein